jgi:hypothetical protein
MSWEETDKTIKSGHRNPETFQIESLKTITLNPKEGIDAIVGKPNGKQTMEIECYLFSKEKGWTLESAKAWFSKLYNAKEHLCAVLPFTIAEKILNQPLRIQGLAMTVGMSRNLNIYTPKNSKPSKKNSSTPQYTLNMSPHKTQWAKSPKQSGTDKT